MFMEHGKYTCGKGWDHIIEALEETIKSILKNANHYGKSLLVEVDDIKEKYGVLAYYYHYEGNTDNPVEDKYPEMIEGAVWMAETMSGHVCEFCGKPGKTREDRGWIKTMCDECVEKEFGPR